MTRKQRRFSLIGSALGVLAVAVALVLARSRIPSSSSIRRPTSSRSMSRPAPASASAAWSKPGSVVRGDNLAVRFEVTDGNSTIPVAYQGLLPDLFREGQGVVTEGALDSAGTFKADSVLAKHDENYMPKEVADALKKQGHWKDEYEKQAGAAAQGRAQ